MINAGLAEYAALISRMGEITITGFEPGVTSLAIVGCVVFLFWLIVFKL
jgi:hypothetical protein